MAYISKIKLGNTSYDVKHSKIYTDGTFAASYDANYVPSVDLVKNYVDGKFSDAIGAGFAIKIEDALPNISNTQAFYDQWKKYLVLVPADTESDIVPADGTYVEYVLINTGTGSTYNLSWEQIGTTKANLNGIKSSGTLDNYVTGVNSVSVSTADSATPTYTSTNVSLTRGDYTPAGTISQKTPAAISITDGSYDKTTRVYTSAYASSTTADYKPAGTVTVTPSSANYSVMKTAGTAYSLTDGSVEQSACTKGTVVNGIGTLAVSTTAPTISTTDNKNAYTASYNSANEELELTAISITASKPTSSFTGSLGTTQAVTDCGEITYTAPTLTGALPTFESKSLVTGITSATFAGAETKFLLTYEPTATGVSGSVSTQPAYTFSGTKETGLKITGAKYDKTTGVDLTKTNKTLSPTVTTTTKTVNVTSSGN